MESDSAMWLRQAEKDLDVAEKNFELEEWYVVAFFCQQAAEKALKAAYIKKFNELAKVHDLVFLGRRLGMPKRLLDGCGYLNRAYTESRYPGETGAPMEKFSKEDADKCIVIAGEVMEWAKKTL